MEPTHDAVLKNDLEVKVTAKPEGDVKVEPNSELRVASRPEAGTESGLLDDPEFKVKSEMKVESNVLVKKWNF